MRHAANTAGQDVHLTLASRADWSKLARLLDSLQPGARLTLHVDNPSRHQRPDSIDARHIDSFADAMRRVEATYYDAP